MYIILVYHNIYVQQVTVRPASAMYYQDQVKFGPILVGIACLQSWYPLRALSTLGIMPNIFT